MPLVLAHMKDWGAKIGDSIDVIVRNFTNREQAEVEIVTPNGTTKGVLNKGDKPFPIVEGIDVALAIQQRTSNDRIKLAYKCPRGIYIANHYYGPPNDKVA